MPDFEEGGSRKVTLKINGDEHCLVVEPRETLREVIHDRLGFTGTKEMCDRGACGSCTVIMDGRPVVSCMMLAIEAGGHEIETVEGIERKNHPLIVPAVAPHAAYTCPPEILQACAKLALEHDIPLHTHISETADEVENMRKETGMPVVPYMKKQGIFEAKTFAAHCVHIDEGEMRTLLHSNVGVAHNPSSNLKLASGIAPVRKMIEVGLNVGIGTDGVASNNDLDFFEEVRLASFLAKGSSGDPTAVPAPKTLEMATRLGAQAIHLDKITGSLEIGKRADMIVVDIHTIHNIPQFNHSEFAPYAQLVYAGKSTDVTDMMVNGKWVMRKRVIKDVNEKEIFDKSKDYAERIDQFLIKREKSVLSKLIAIGEPVIAGYDPPILPWFLKHNEIMIEIKTFG